jgi:hypothetical protein
MAGHGYLAVETTSAPVSCRDASRRAWLARHRIDLLEIDAESVRADPLKAARGFFEIVHERNARARRSTNAAL